MKKTLLPIIILTILVSNFDIQNSQITENFSFSKLIVINSAIAESNTEEHNDLLKFQFIRLVENMKKGYSGVFIATNNHKKNLYGFSGIIKFYEGSRYIRWTSYSQFNGKDPIVPAKESKEITFLDGIASSIDRVEIEVTSTSYR